MTADVDVVGRLVCPDGLHRVDARRAALRPAVEHVVLGQREVEAVLVAEAVQQVRHGAAGSLVRLDEHHAVVRHAARAARHQRAAALQGVLVDWVVHQALDSREKLRLLLERLPQRLLIGRQAQQLAALHGVLVP